MSFTTGCKSGTTLKFGIQVGLILLVVLVCVSSALAQGEKSTKSSNIILSFLEIGLILTTNTFAYAGQYFGDISRKFMMIWHLHHFLKSIQAPVAVSWCQ